MMKITAAALIFLISVFSPFQHHISAAAEKDGTVQDYLQQKDKTTDSEKKSEKSVPAPQVENKPGVTAWDFIKMIFATLFVVGLIYILFRLISSRNKLMKPVNYLQTLGGTSLGQNRSIQLVKAGEEILLVGVGDSIQLLKVIENEEEVERIIRQYEDKGVDLQGAKTIVSKAVQSIGVKSEEKNRSSFKQALQKQLEELGSERKQKEQEWIRKGTGRNE
ncbi:flagellar biosynthetic protein FliO [Bacillus sp. SJS]|uniref:flagellar biosynthetic protein FliO n=1 Tax=Bacillus sp. SJS TaxID=1423321 RepID=UPI0012E78818|nr:flagellar biosynthetic protein FliO [Bacillus sp. SJS]